jgi:hypothetical protein
LQKVKDYLVRNEKYFSLEYLGGVFIHLLEAEKDKDIYGIIEKTIVNIAGHMVKVKRHSSFIGLIKEINLLLEKPGISDSQRQRITTVKASVLTPDIIGELIESLKQRIEGNRDYGKLVRLFIHIGREAVMPLLNICVNEENSGKDKFAVYALRWKIAKIIEKMDKQMLAEVLSETLACPQTPLKQIENAIDFVGLTKNELAVSGLRRFTKHPDSGLRKSLALNLGKIQSKESSALLETMLQDEDLNIRLCSVRALGHIGDAAIVNRLKMLTADKKLGREAKRSIEQIENKLAAKEG